MYEGQTILRGSIYYADLDPIFGCEQGGKRPVIVLQNNIGNKNSPTVVIAPITSRGDDKPNLPTHVKISCSSCGINNTVLLEQLRTI